MPSNENKVGCEIRRIRLKRGWNQRELSRESGVDYTYINKIERGKRCPLDAIEKIQECLGVSHILALAEDDKIRKAIFDLSEDNINRICIELRHRLGSFEVGPF